MLKVYPFTTATLGFELLRDTGRSASDVAIRIRLGSPTLAVAGFKAKVIVWEAGFTTTVFWMEGAAAQVESPAWLAVSVAVPAPITLRTLFGPTDTTPGAELVIVTGRADVAEALTTGAESP